MARLRVVKAILVLLVLFAPALAAAVGTLAPEAGGTAFAGNAADWAH
jgi:hypothetical protein